MAGWVIFAIGIVLVPLWAVYLIGLRSPLSNLRKAFVPSAKWGPKDAKKYQEWVLFKAQRHFEKRELMDRKGLSEWKFKIPFLINRHQKNSHQSMVDYEINSFLSRLIPNEF